MSVAAQKRVFTKWITLNLSQSKDDVPEKIDEDNFVDVFQDGHVLLKLVEVLSHSTSDIKTPKSQNKLQVMGYITEVLKFVEKQDMKLTISAENIYGRDETMILGLIWTLILKYQVGKKQEILAWLRVLVDEQIKNFDADWKDGILFCKLVEALSGLQAPLGSEVKTRLEWAFSNAESKLGITEIISAEDMTSGYFDERSCLTYLSFFYNKYKHIGKKEEPKKEDDRVPILEARIKELEALTEEKHAMLDKSTNEIQAIIKNTKTLHDELAEQKEINKEISQSIEELQLKLPFLNQKAVKNEIPAPTGNNSLNF